MLRALDVCLSREEYPESGPNRYNSSSIASPSIVLPTDRVSPTRELLDIISAEATVNVEVNDEPFPNRLIRVEVWRQVLDPTAGGGISLDDKGGGGGRREGHLSGCIRGSGGSEVGVV